VRASEKVQLSLIGSRRCAFYRIEHSESQPKDDKPSLKGAWLLSSNLFNFWKISDNISKTAQDSLIVSIKLE